MRSAGFTFTELAVSLAISAFVVLGISGILYEFHIFESKTFNKVAYQDFLFGVENYLKSTNGCSAALVGQTLDLTPREIALGGFKGLPEERPPRAGEAVNLQVSISSLTLKEKPIVGSGEALRKAVGSAVTQSLIRKIGAITLEITNTVANQPPQKKTHEVDVSVLVNSSNVIQSCMISKDISGACELMGSKLDPSGATKTCVPTTTCQFYGRYITSSCTSSDPAYPATPGAAPCIGAANASGQPPTNEFTGDISCPAGAQAMPLGETSQQNTFTVSCGKKCTSTVTHRYQEDFFMCLRCM
jgi:hypothetical protein